MSQWLWVDGTVKIKFYKTPPEGYDNIKEKIFGKYLSMYDVDELGYENYDDPDKDKEYYIPYGSEGSLEIKEKCTDIYNIDESRIEETITYAISGRLRDRDYDYIDHIKQWALELPRKSYQYNDGDVACDITIKTNGIFTISVKY
ncbi:MAG: hypothetical protein IKR19_07550 [Acholeplasmatales bacterium]|nr:hypothetical protein [Acholeplasmatales bacterium]